MKIAITYLGIAAIGYLVAAFLSKNNKAGSGASGAGSGSGAGAGSAGKEAGSWIGKVLPLIVTALIFTMGFRIGENQEVVANMGTIGIQSLIMSLVSIAICIAVLTLVRRLMGYDHYAMRKGEGEERPDEAGASKRKPRRKAKLFTPSTIRYLTAVVLGFLLGYLLVLRFEAVSFETASSVSATFITYGLYLMVFLVGMDMGFDGSLPKTFRSTGLRALVIPIATAVATAIAMVLMSFFVDLGTKEMVCIGCTFGWYSLGPNIIMDAGMITAGAYAFLVNFLRDMISILIIPWVAETFGYIETIGLPQAAAMDVCIATIEGATNKATTALAFFSGVVFTIFVPVLLPIIAG